MNLTRIRSLFLELRESGFVSSKRKGPTGIGFTLECYLALKESNVSLPDFGSIELKSKRIKSNSPITLFTLNRIAWSLPVAEVIKHYGYYDPKRQRNALYCVVSNALNTQGLKLDITSIGLVKIIDAKDEIVGTWSVGAVRDKIIEKMQALLLVKAESKTINGIEHFWYKEASILTGLDYNKFFEALSTGGAFIDIRMHLKPNGAVRNHGTGWRIRPETLESLYTNVIKLEEDT